MKKTTTIFSILALIASGYGQAPKKQATYSTDWACQDAGTVVFRQFQPDTLADFNYPLFVAFESFKINDLKFLFGRYNTINLDSDEVKDTPSYSTRNDFGFRMLSFNAESQKVFRSRGAFDSRSFIPYFFISDDEKQVIILCQMGDEHGSMGAVMFLVEEDRVYNLGFISEPYDTEEYWGREIAYIASIKRINNALVVSFPDTLRVVRSFCGTVVYLSTGNIKYVYTGGRMTRKTIEQCAPQQQKMQ